MPDARLRRLVALAAPEHNRAAAWGGQPVASNSAAPARRTHARQPVEAPRNPMDAAAMDAAAPTSTPTSANVIATGELERRLGGRRSTRSRTMRCCAHRCAGRGA